MEDLHMDGEPSIFVWEVRCKSSRPFAHRLRDFWWEDFSSFLQPSTQTSISLAFEFLHPLSSGDCLCVKKGLRCEERLLLWDRASVQLEYTKKQGTEDLDSIAIFKLGYTKKQGTKHLDSTIIFELHSPLSQFVLFKTEAPSALKPAFASQTRNKAAFTEEKCERERPQRS